MTLLHNKYAYSVRVIVTNLPLIDKPHVEHFIGTLEKERLQWGGVAIDLDGQQEIINTWLA